MHFFFKSRTWFLEKLISAWQHFCANNAGIYSASGIHETVSEKFWTSMARYQGIFWPKKVRYPAFSLDRGDAISSFRFDVLKNQHQRCCLKNFGQFWKVRSIERQPNMLLSPSKIIQNTYHESTRKRVKSCQNLNPYALEIVTFLQNYLVNAIETIP